MEHPNEIHIRSILEDDAYYRKCYDVYLSRLSFPDVDREGWRSDITSKLVPTLTKSVASSASGSDGRQTLKCMGIGSGDGECVCLDVRVSVCAVCLCV